MGLLGKIKEFIGSDDESYELEQDDMDIIAKTEDKKDKQKSFDDKAIYNSNEKKSGKVLNIHTTAQLQVVLVKPERFDDAVSIADHLNDKRTVVLNLESTNKEVSRRLVDFLSGVAYANDGQIKKVANSTFIITPYNVDIMGDLLDELESTGVFY
ncbi:MAG: cell division protein SepF [Bacillota bacterium]|nr:cell division protein SepF [Bacillota bacterium]